MARKKYYDEYGNEIRSRPSKPFYKKGWFWIIVGLGIIFGAIGTYILGNENEIVDEPIEQGGEDNVEEVEEMVVVDPEVARSEEAEEEIIEEPRYTYEDFKGTYVTFEGDPYNSSVISDIEVLGDDFYQSFNRWDIDMTSPILDKTIEGNVLTLDLDSEESKAWGLHSETGIEQYELSYEDNKKILYSITDDHTLYSMSTQDLQTHYSQLEIDYARIIMTINGEPSLDQWAMWNGEWGVPVVKVSYNSVGDPTEVSNQVSYPEDVTHLDLTSQTMAAGIITYSAHGDGYITRYPMPLHYHQEDQSEEGYRQLAQKALDDASAIYIEPFEPYAVADFIERVEFVYE